MLTFTVLALLYSSNQFDIWSAQPSISRMVVNMDISITAMYAEGQILYNFN
jgi:hypothetical protein